VCLCLGLSVALPAVLAGCGESGASGALGQGQGQAAPRQLRLERIDLAIVARGLLRAEPSIRREIAAARAAWPGIVHGLPAQAPPATRALLAAALGRTEQIATPSFISYAGELTGESAAIAGLLLSYEQLSAKGWSMTLTAAGHLNGASTLPPATLAFLRTNAALYIGCVYDAHYNLSVIGERMRETYAQLGGAAGFGGAARLGGTAGLGVALPASLMAQVIGFYSPGVARLAPKPPSSAVGG
jgi:hypothetical protein